MRGNELLNKMELVDSAYLKVADKSPSPQKRGRLKYGVVAACLCVALLMSFWRMPTSANLIVNHNDRSYEYTDYRVDSDLRYSDKGGTITEDELRSALGTLGIDVPDAAQFVAVDEERGKYVFRAECVVEDGVLTAGELTCHIAEGGILYKVDNALSVSTLHGDATDKKLSYYSSIKTR